MEFEALYQELANGRDILRALVSGVTQAEAQVKPSPESWSIFEVVCHLYDEERDDFREHLDMILNRPNDEWKRLDPQKWVTPAQQYHERSLSEMLDRFSAERDQSLAWLRGLSSANWDVVYTTPFRSMTAGDMFASWVAHDHLHMRQLVELRRARLLTLAAPYNVEYAGDW